jgi:hypothetical protein
MNSGFLLFLMASLPGQWMLSDTTDNISGKRSAWALLVSEQGTAPLQIICNGGRPVFNLTWQVPLGSNYALIQLTVANTDDSVGGSNTPMPWDLEPTNKTIAASPQTIFADLGPLDNVDLIILNVESPLGAKTVVYNGKGIKEAYDYISKTCS